ncbi:41560_t:CDS:2, partial [Gigaspora margarita]
LFYYNHYYEHAKNILKDGIIITPKNGHAKNLRNVIGNNAISLKKRATTFIACSNPYDHFNIIVSPDPLIPGQNATFSVSGTLKQDITNNGVLIIEFQNQYFVPVGVDPTTSVLQTTAGNQFNVVFELKVPPNLPSSYNILALRMVMCRSVVQLRR